MSADGPSPWERWSSIAPEQQEEVDRLARVGRRHSDPEVAAAAEAWARVLVDAAEEERLSPMGRLAYVAVNIALELTPFGGDALPSQETLDDRAQLAWARRVLAAR